MLYLFVQVNESIKCILSEHVVSIEPANNQFSDLFEAITFGQYIDRKVQVFIRREKTESWREVNNGLKGDLEMMFILGLIQVKFCLIENTNTEMPVSAPNNEPNAFNILMNNSRKLLLPQYAMVVTDFSMISLSFFSLKELVGWVVRIIRLANYFYIYFLVY